jgi:GDPmannose 4,6-dehydratase
MTAKLKNRVKALIIGISGQDGPFLTKFLLAKNYEVFGTSRNLDNANLGGLKFLGVLSEVKLLEMCPKSYDDVFHIISTIQPDEIYNLSGQSSVSLSFKQPTEAIKSIAGATLNILESLRLIEGETKFYNAGSGEVFGDTHGTPASENTPFDPVSPYGVAKTEAALQVNLYRNVYGLHACTGILFNHESFLRPNDYVTKKIVEACCRIGKGSVEKLLLGNIKISRDWGYAPEYVEAMWAMLQEPTAQDFIIATGRSVSLEYFVDVAFAYFGLDWKEHVVIDSRYIRDSEIMVGAADPGKAHSVLNWKAIYTVEDLVRNMIEHNLNLTS